MSEWPLFVWNGAQWICDGSRGGPPCWWTDLLVAVTRVSPGLDPANSLFRILWARALWVRAGGGPARSAALWSWSPGGFQTPPGVCGHGSGSPSVLGGESEGQQQLVRRGHVAVVTVKKEGRHCNSTNTHPRTLLSETVFAGGITVVVLLDSSLVSQHYPTFYCIRMSRNFHHDFSLYSPAALLRDAPHPHISSALVQYSKNMMGRESKTPLSTKPHGAKVALCRKKRHLFPVILPPWCGAFQVCALLVAQNTETLKMCCLKWTKH